MHLMILDRCFTLLGTTHLFKIGDLVDEILRYIMIILMMNAMSDIVFIDSILHKINGLINAGSIDAI